MISLSGLRADALGFHGRQPSSSPFLDSFAGRALFYERALTPSPDTLVAHVSLLSGLYPAEHRVVPPAGTLAAEVTVLPERFAEYGYRTAGFTSGGYLSSDFGFDRGFDRFGADTSGSKSPFSRGIEFLREVGDDSFFVFLHSDVLEEALLSSRIDLEGLVAGNVKLTAEVSRRVEAAYFEALAQLDREIRTLCDELEALNLLGETVVVMTADHGFEFGEHGRLGHSQVYPETVGVPLLIVVPGLEAERVPAFAQTVDVAPSLYSLAGLPMPRLSGRILPGLPGAVEPRRWAVAEVRGRWAQQALFLEVEGRSYQSVQSQLRGEHDGTWVTRGVTFDTFADRLEFSIVSFLRGRTVRIAFGGQTLSELEIGPRWVAKDLSLPRQLDRKRLRFSAEDCESPSDLGAGSDRRCLSFKLRGLELSKSELFDLSADPGAMSDISLARPVLAAQLRSRLARHTWKQAALPDSTRPRAATLAAITARAEDPEPP